MVVLAVAGILLDRYLALPEYLWPIVVGIGAIGWLTQQKWWGLAVAIAGLAAFHHHLHCYRFPHDDIGAWAADEPRLLRLCGRIAEPVSVDVPTRRDPLRSIPESARTHAIIAAQWVEDGSGWHAVSGRVAATLLGAKTRLNVGDRLQFTGWLARPRPPDNPGERDRIAEARDQRIRATFLVRHLQDATFDHSLTTTKTWMDWHSNLRNWSAQKLHEQLPGDVAGVAAALLLGDSAALARQEWEKYIRTGVVHVLAVSGQHLSILAGMAWIVLRSLGVRRRHGALAIAAGITLYSLMVGWQPAVLRATVMVLVACWAMWLRRPAYPGNMLALALVVILLFNPTDIANAGCQFSFVCTAILIWGLPTWLHRNPDRLRQLEDRLKPRWQQWLFSTIGIVGRAYLVTLVFFLVLAPLTAYRYHLLTPVGILIGPPAIALASIALLAGFALLVGLILFPWVVVVFAPVVRWPLQWLSHLVDSADGWPAGWFYIGTVDLWWVIGFYGIVVGALWWPVLRDHFRWSIIVALIWLIVGLAANRPRSQNDNLTITFLAVGHGGATVIETPDRRVILIDCGSMQGPEVTRRIIAPFLWHRGINRIDEVYISHADLDHFNGLPALLQRFPIGQISVTPSFASKLTPAVAQLLQELSRMNIPVVVRQNGDRMTAGNVEWEVWHPPEFGPSGPENARSLVVAIRHCHHLFVLTGDLDLDGRPMVMTRLPPSIDVWLAPHHGGRSANPPELASWARARVVVAHNGIGEAHDALENYEQVGSCVLGTWPHGAVMVESRPGGFTVQTYRSRHIQDWPDP
jgi:competence protein ComEC